MPAERRRAFVQGVLLEDLTWLEAERVLTSDAVVVVPLGAAAKEHGPHLLLKNDWLIAEWLKQRICEVADVVVAPTVSYHYYPAFVEYPGSTSLRLEVARDLIVDICRSLAAFGPRRFYVLNTGLSTVRALAPAAELLRRDGILLTYTDVVAATAAVEKERCEQERGSHADEAETSIMLCIAPETVDMRRAVKDCAPAGRGGLSRRPETTKTYSPSGVWGDATLATRAKGEALSRAFVDAALKDIDALRKSALPVKQAEETSEEGR